jgi:hypothetical protein
MRPRPQSFSSSSLNVHRIADEIEGDRHYVGSLLKGNRKGGLTVAISAEFLIYDFEILIFLRFDESGLTLNQVAS